MINMINKNDLLLNLDETKLNKKNELLKINKNENNNKIKNIETEEIKTNFKLTNKLELSSGIKETFDKVNNINTISKKIKEGGTESLEKEEIEFISNTLKENKNNIKTDDDLIKSLKNEKENIITNQKNEIENSKKTMSNPIDAQNPNINAIVGNLVYSQANIQPFIVKHLLQ